MPTSNRNACVDLTKAFAIFCVIVIHLCSFDQPIRSFEWTFSVLSASLARAAVPLFFMCSGALFLDPDRELPVKKLMTRYIPRILVALFVWAGAYALFGLLRGGDFSVGAIAEALKDLLLFRHEFHLYYLHITLLFYALLPILRILTVHATQRELLYALGIWFVLGIVYPTLRPFWPFSLLSGIPAQWLLNMAWASAGYGLLGHYLGRYPLSRKTGAALAAAGFLLIFGGTIVVSCLRGATYQGFLEGMSLGVCLYAAGLFALFTHVGNTLAGRPAVAAAWISKASFCIYLVHVFFLYGLRAVRNQIGLPPPGLHNAF
ncbi:MAG: hypothetical protein E7463_00050 [Ruminococcaceae bacterium]|nr:hypothetical protein [Oscillospiraceae bacterium]